LEQGAGGDSVGAQLFGLGGRDDSGRPTDADADQPWSEIGCEPAIVSIGCGVLPGST
jgi:hypothetical protein